MTTSVYVKLYNLLLGISLLQYCEHEVTAVTMISHPRTASVCSGAQLELICTSTRDFLQWHISIPTGTASRMYSRALTTNSQEWQILDNLTTFTFSVIPSHSSMLTSRLLVSPITDGLNRTNVNCVDDDDTSSFTVDVFIKAITIGTQETKFNISVRPKQFESDGVVTFLEWTQEHSRYSYYVTVSPDTALWINGSASINLKLKVPYDKSHNVSVVATPPCGNDTITRSTELFYSYYGFCGNPTDQIQGDGVTVTGQTTPVIEIGTNVTLNCMPGLIQIGPNSSMCTENGEWEPDLREVYCLTLTTGRATEVEVMTESDLDGRQTLSQNGKIAIASAVVFTVAFAVAFIIGFLCGFLCRKQRNNVSFSSAPQTSPHNNPALNQKVYENALDLQENASYASIQ